MIVSEVLLSQCRSNKWPHGMNNHYGLRCKTEFDIAVRRTVRCWRLLRSDMIKVKMFLDSSQAVFSSKHSMKKGA